MPASTEIYTAYTLCPYTALCRSLGNHTMVPTLTIFGRVSECTRWVIADPEVPTALVTDRSMTLRRKRRPLGSTIGASLGSSSRDRAANALVAWSEYAGAMA